MPLDDKDLKLSLLNYLSLLGSSRKTSEDIHQNIHTCVAGTEPLSYYQIERRARNLSGLTTWECDDLPIPTFFPFLFLLSPVLNMTLNCINYAYAS